MFRMSTKSNTKPKEQTFIHPQKMNYRPDDTVFQYDNPPRTPQQLLWQTLTPEMRAEALKRVQLIHMLRQVNPELQLCRKNSMNDAGVQAAVTEDKGVQVPDIRFEFISNRRQNNNSNNNSNYHQKKWATFIAPGIRINQKQQNNDVQSKSFTEAYTNRSPNRREQHRVSFKPLNDVIPPLTKKPSKKIEIKAPIEECPKESKENFEDAKKDSLVGEKEQNNVEKPSQTNLKILDDHNETIEITISTNCDKDESKGEQKTERQVSIKPKETSSGEEEDSVVVVLNQPRTGEQGLERKYGQFFCRRCMRGWSSRSVWCVRHTCKVYIKQTCNICNKMVNPYLVCRLPPGSTSSNKSDTSVNATTDIKKDEN